ncbi:MAG TPA: hypothetical protein V6C84_03560 [Coleofasciculaceae cyanobacterium]
MSKSKALTHFFTYRISTYGVERAIACPTLLPLPPDRVSRAIDWALRS